MDIENLKDLWNKDQPKDTPKISIEGTEKLNSPVKMLRLNMKTEFFLWCLIIIPYGCYTIISGPDDSNTRIISILICLLMLMIMLYFGWRFKKLYSLLEKRDVSTNYGLFTLKTQLLVSRELYISYYISYIPMVFLTSLIQIKFHFDFKYSGLIFTISFLLSVLILFILIKNWFYLMYGKYINQIECLVDELNGMEIPEDLKPKKISRFEKSQSYFIEKFGIFGNILNTIIWFLLFYAFFFLILVVFFFILLLALIKLDIASKEEVFRVLSLMK